MEEDIIYLDLKNINKISPFLIVNNNKIVQKLKKPQIYQSRIEIKIEIKQKNGFSFLNYNFI
jgi:transcriptional antiterminator